MDELGTVTIISDFKKPNSIVAQYKDPFRSYFM